MWWYRYTYYIHVHTCVVHVVYFIPSKTKYLHLHPRLNELNPPGGASLRVVDLPVITFPLF